MQLRYLKGFSSETIFVRKPASGLALIIAGQSCPKIMFHSFIHFVFHHSPEKKQQQQLQHDDFA